MVGRLVKAISCVDVQLPKITMEKGGEAFLTSPLHLKKG